MGSEDVETPDYTFVDDVNKVDRAKLPDESVFGDVAFKVSETSPSLKRRAGCVIYVAIIGTAMIFTAVILLSLSQGSLSSQVATKNSEKQHHCGSTPLEAAATGCKFDIMSRSWVPVECFYSLIDSQFQEQHKSPYYANSNGTQVVGEAELAHYTDTVYTAANYHRLHCVFLLRRNHLAVKTGGPLPKSMTSYRHTEHCTEVLMEPKSAMDLQEIIPIFDLSFPKCVSAREALNLSDSGGAVH